MLIPACAADVEPLCGRSCDRLVFKDRFHDHHQPVDARAEHHLHLHIERRRDAWCHDGLAEARFGGHDDGRRGTGLPRRA